MNGTSKLLRVTSNDLSNSSHGTDTDLDFRTNDGDLHQIHRVLLKTVIFPNTFYNINKYNNYIGVVGDDMEPVGPIEMGQYNLSQYIASLIEVLNVASAPHTFTVVQDPITRKLMFTKSGGDEFTLLGKKDGNRQWRESGCKETVTSEGLVAFTSAIPDLSGLRHVYIESLIAGAQILTGDVNKYSILADFPISVPFGAYQTIEYDEHTMNQVTYRGAKQLSKFDLRFTDDQNRELDLNGLDWFLVFECHGVGT